MRVLACQLRAFIARDFVADFTYRLSFAIGIVDAIAAVGAYYLLSTMIGVKPGGYDAFAFILIGLTLNSAMTTAMVCYASAIRESQQTFTLPLLVSSPLTARRFILLSSAYPLLRATVEGLAFLAVGVALGLALRGANVAGAALVFVLALAAFSAIGVLSAACIVVWKKGDPVLWLIGSASWLFGGVFFPIEQLPAPLQALSRLLPISYALEALRPAVLGGVPLGEIARRAAPLAAFTVVAVPVSLMAFTWAVTRARHDGSLRQF
jgi:ABC-2 type transport system permease protein